MGDNTTFEFDWPPDAVQFGNSMQVEVTPANGGAPNEIDVFQQMDWADITSTSFLGPSIFDDSGHLFGSPDAALSSTPPGNDFSQTGDNNWPSLDTSNNTVSLSNNHFSNRNLPTIMEDSGPNSSNFNSVLTDQLGLRSPGNQIIRNPMAGSLTADGHQPSHQARGRPRPKFSKQHKWKENLTSYSDHSQTPRMAELALSDQELLEANYRFKPNPTEEQMTGLAVWAGLTYDEVRDFYEWKSPPQKPSGANSRQRSRLSIPGKRPRPSSPSSQSEIVDSAYGTRQSEYSVSIDGSERSKIPRLATSRPQSREPPMKPFECTWAGCNITSASKSDWIRHEECVHCLQNYWVCTLPYILARDTVDGRTCSRRFKRDDKLRDHLKSDHGCEDQSRIRAGRREVLPHSPFNHRCGFCGYTANDWPNRMNHIADHFKKGKRMSEWKDPWPEDDSGGGSDSSDSNNDDDNYSYRESKNSHREDDDNNDSDNDSIAHDDEGIEDKGNGQLEPRGEDGGEDAMAWEISGLRHTNSQGFNRRHKDSGHGLQDHALLNSGRQYEATNVGDGGWGNSAIFENKEKDPSSADLTKIQLERVQKEPICGECSHKLLKGQTLWNPGALECLDGATAIGVSEIYRNPHLLSEAHLQTSDSTGLDEDTIADLRALRSGAWKSRVSDYALPPGEAGPVMQEPDHRNRQDSHNILSYSMRRSLNPAPVPLSPAGRDSVEVRVPKGIAKDIRIDALQLLRKYYTEVRLNLSSLSKPSTTTPGLSESSAGTPVIDMNTRFLVLEDCRKPLDSATRAKKSLLRKLGACQSDCRKRKLKCQLWHHALHDLLEIDHEPLDEVIVEWAIKLDAEPKAPVTLRYLPAYATTVNPSYSDQAVDGSSAEATEEGFEIKKPDEVKGSGIQKKRFKNKKVAELLPKSSLKAVFSTSSWIDLTEPASAAIFGLPTKPSSNSSHLNLNATLSESRADCPKIDDSTQKGYSPIRRYIADDSSSNLKCTFSSVTVTAGEVQGKAKARMKALLDEFERVFPDYGTEEESRYGRNIHEN